jgi:SAM-dependent methyltransferase
MDDDEQPAGTAGYSLQLSDQERMRYRMMAASAADNEAAEWSAAGIGPGARVADVGCGPGAVLRLLADRVGPGGRAVGIDADPAAVSMARQETAGHLAALTATGGFATGTDIRRWEEAFARLDSAKQRPWLFPANFVALGRRG